MGNKGVNCANIRNVKFNEWSVNRGIIRRDGENICPNFLQPFLENIVRRSRNGGAGSFMQYFTTLTEKADSSLLGVVLTQEHLKGMPS